MQGLSEFHNPLAHAIRASWGPLQTYIPVIYPSPRLEQAPSARDLQLLTRLVIVEYGRNLDTRCTRTGAVVHHN
jgi:hypothetical protein